MAQINQVDNVSGEFITVNCDALAKMLGCGKAMARKIGKEAHAEVRIGDKKRGKILYNVELVKAYIAKQSK